MTRLEPPGLVYVGYRYLLRNFTFGDPPSVSGYEKCHLERMDNDVQPNRHAAPVSCTHYVVYWDHAQHNAKTTLYLFYRAMTPTELLVLE